MSTALDIPQFEEVVRVAVSKIKGGFWVAAANDHGSKATSFHLFTLWNVNHDINVFYINFCKASAQPLNKFIDDTRAKLVRWGIKINLTLQDGLQKRGDTIYPLLHFSLHSKTFLCLTTLLDRSNKVVHSCHVLESALPLVIPLNRKFTAIDKAIGNLDRSQDHFINECFPPTAIAHLSQILARQAPTHETHFLTTALLECINYIRQRQDITSEQELRDNTSSILERLDIVKRYFDLKNMTKNYAKKDIPSSIVQYKALFQRDPLLPYEALIFTPEYEVSYYYKSMKRGLNRHYLLDRMKSGHIYENGIQMWSGSTTKKIIFTSYDIRPFIKLLAQTLPVV